jgi:hypothetical protein
MSTQNKPKQHQGRGDPEWWTEERRAEMAAIRRAKRIGWAAPDFWTEARRKAKSDRMRAMWARLRELDGDGSR